VRGAADCEEFKIGSIIIRNMMLNEIPTIIFLTVDSLL